MPWMSGVIAKCVPSHHPTRRNWANKWSYEYVKYAKMISYVKAIFKFAVINNLIRTNPFDAIKTPAKHKESEAKELWTVEQLEIFLDACKEDEREMVLSAFPPPRLHRHETTGGSCPHLV